MHCLPILLLRPRWRTVRMVLCALVALAVGIVSATRPAAASEAVPDTPLPRITVPETAHTGELNAAGLDAVAQLDDGWSNTGATECIVPLGVAYDAAYVAGLVLGYIGGFYAAAAQWGANLGLKYCAPIVEPPPTLTRNPGTRCAADVLMNRTSGRYANTFGISTNPISPGSGWGDLDSPHIYHFNTSVNVSLHWLEGGDPLGWERIEPGALDLPVGVYPLVWRGSTLISPLDSNPVGILIGWFPLKKLYGQQGFSAAFIGWLALKVGHKVAQRLIEPYPHGVYNDEIQRVIVFDLNAPEFSGVQQSVTVEAGIPGGASPQDNLLALRQGFTVTDDCDDTITVLSNTGNFWPVGQESTVTWTASDSGPAPGDGVNETTMAQQIQVVDTRPPIIAPPMAVVTETVSGELVLSLPAPPVFDFADLNPNVTHDQGDNVEEDGIRFAKGKTTVTWTAEDAAGNVATAQQLVNVKAIGENNAPTANSQTGGQASAAGTQAGNQPLQAISFEPLTLTLSASDPDDDPLWFTIEQQPPNGFFVAPLFPYFIEDYRVESGMTDEEIQDICDNDPPQNTNFFQLEFPRAASYVAVQDDGTTLVVDKGEVQCRNHLNLPVQFHDRMAIFDGSGQLVANNSVPDNLQDIYIDPNTGDIFLTSYSGPGGPGYVNWLDEDLNLLQVYRTDYSEVPAGLPDSSLIREPNNAVIDSNGILYVSERGRLRAYSLDLVDCCALTTLGSLIENSQEGIEDLAVDSQGNLYVSLRQTDRVAKYSPSHVADDGTFTPGQLIGWMGKCDADLGDGSAVHCDVANHRSIGYSCSDETCGVTEAPNPDPAFCSPTQINGFCTPGDGPGQFNEPHGIAIDPNDNLYVTDYGNLRVQRFTPEGYYAGQAVSKCGGSCFVLGDFNAPRDITVNSDHFYILDDNTNLLHVSQTSPIVDKTDSTATVVYQSDNNFVGTDSFVFQATDGLALSNPATVEIDVSRNFRPPFARAGLAATLTEDTPAQLELAGSDPDIPLDTLLYTITTPPMFGEISDGNGAQRTYTPDPDFAGVDSFEFVVGDGRFTSEPELFRITVTPVNDAPALASNTGVTGGIGYRTTFTATLTDADLDDSHSLTIDWGDGTVHSGVQAGAYAHLLASSITQNEETPLFTDTRNGTGAIHAEHIYTSPPADPISVCVSDEAGEEACRTLDVTIELMADIVVAVDGEDPVALGEEITYRIIVAHSAPESGSGVTATGLTVEDVLNPGVNFIEATPSQGACNFAADAITCDLGSLAPDAMATVDVRLAPGAALGIGAQWGHLVSVTLDQATPRDTVEYEDSVTIVEPADFLVNSELDGPDVNPGDGVCATASDLCSLRAALEESNVQAGPQTISLSADVYNTDLSEDALALWVASGIRPAAAGPLFVTDDTTITGLGAYTSTLSGGGNTRILVVQNDAVVTIRGVQLSDGSSQGAGGAILVESGDLTLARVLMTQNRAVDGGAIAMQSGRVTVIDSALFANVVTGTGGALYAGGGTVQMTNVTVGANRAGIRGGGIANHGSLEMTHVTLAGNQAETEGGGLYTDGTARFAFSLLGNNHAPTGPDCLGAITSQGPNLVQNGDGCDAGGATTGQDPGLAYLEDNGGDTLTYLLRVSSPAQEAGACTVATDQRGRAREEDCDLGAVEIDASDIVDETHVFLPTIHAQ